MVVWWHFVGLKHQGYRKAAFVQNMHLCIAETERSLECITHNWKVFSGDEKVDPAGVVTFMFERKGEAWVKSLGCCSESFLKAALLTSVHVTTSPCSWCWPVSSFLVFIVGSGVGVAFEFSVSTISLCKVFRVLIGAFLCFNYSFSFSYRKTLRICCPYLLATLFSAEKHPRNQK